jgi:hypothetical protein
MPQSLEDQLQALAAVVAEMEQRIHALEVPASTDAGEGPPSE